MGSSPTGSTNVAPVAEMDEARYFYYRIRGFESCLALQVIQAVLAQCRERIGPNDEDAG